MSHILLVDVYYSLSIPHTPPPLEIHHPHPFARLSRPTAGRWPIRHLTWFSDATPLIGRRAFARLRSALPSFIPGNPPPSFVPYRVSW